MKHGRPVSVLYLNHCASLSGGAERSLAELLKALPTERVAATVALPDQGSLAEELSAFGIPCHTVPFLPLRRSRHPLFILHVLLNLRRAGALLRPLAARRQCQVVHANSTTAAVYACFAFRRSQIPVVWHCRDLVELGWLGRWLGRHVRVAVAISLTVRANLATCVASDRIRVILNGVDRDRLKKGASRSDLRNRWDIDMQAPLVGMAAHLVPWKNHALFLQACARLASIHPDARYIIAGGDVSEPVPGYREELRRDAAMLGIEDRVTFLGDCQDMAGFYRSIDFLCHPTACEPFGRSVAEAMMAGCPVLAMRGGGPGEFIADGIDGMLARAGDAEDIADRLSAMINHPDLARTMAMAAAAKAERDLSINRVATQIADLYDDLVQDT